MPASVLLRLSIGVALFSVALVARADVPPDPDSPDAHCTPAEQCPTGVYCDYEWRPGAPEEEWATTGLVCRTDAESKGLERRCRNGNNYSGQALYCPKGATGSWFPGKPEAPTPTPEPPTPTPEPPAPAKSEAAAASAGAAPVAAEPAAKGMCSIAGEGGSVGLLAVVLAFARRRRR